MRFSIRDLLWLTLVVAMGLGWWISYKEIYDRHHVAVSQASRLRTMMEQLWAANLNSPAASHVLQHHFDFDWRILDEPFVEP